MGNGGVLYRTTDGGATWTLSHPNPARDFDAVSFADAKHGWIVVWHQALLATSDGGTTWEVVKSVRAPGPWADLYDVASRNVGSR